MANPVIDKADVTAAFNPKPARKTVKAHVVTAAKYNLKYIVEHLKGLGEYELEEIERKLKAQDLEQRTGIHVNDRGEVYNSNIKLDLLLPIEKLVKEMDKGVKGYGDIDFKAYNQLNSIITSYYLRHQKGNSYTVSSMEGYFLPSLMIFLDYITKGKIAHDLAAVHKWLEDNDLKKAIYSTQFAFEYNGVQIKKFKNGRLDLKFKKGSDGEKCARTIDQWWEAYRKR